jgi:arginine/ornithine transport system permease protein
VLVGLATFYTTIIRGIPELVLMLLVFYGGSIGINTCWKMLGSGSHLDIEPFTGRGADLGFIYGAYMTETFRGAILAFPRPDGGRLGVWHGPVQIFLRITAPQMVRYALPGFTNNWLVLIKATALVSLIGLQEMTYLAKQASAATRSPFAFFLFTGRCFWSTPRPRCGAAPAHARYSLGTKRGTL